MELKEFIEKFAEQFDEMEESVFTSDVVFKELDEWSSLIALSVIAMVDEEYDIQLKSDDVMRAQTISDLFNIVSSKVD